MHIDISNRQSAKLGLYFHVPFCPQLCPYCDFVKTDKFSLIDTQIYFQKVFESLCSFMNGQDELGKNETRRPVTVYFGGGTPGLFWGSQFLQILEKIKASFDIEECTIETNPAHVSEKKIKSWFEVGFNRVTLGSQSTNESVLKFLGRKHSPKQVFQAIEWSRKAGFENIQADLIFGLPAEFAMRRIESELLELGNAGVSGISSYSLTVEQNTVFFEKGVEPSEEKACFEYDLIQNYCTSANMIQRETSNFSKFECKHNNIYWYGYPYEGFGPGAHGLQEPDTNAAFGRRYRVGKMISGEKRKQDFPGRDSFEFGRNDSTDFKRFFDSNRTRADYLTEMLFTLMRTPQGIPLNWIESQFGAEKTEQFLYKSFITQATESGKLQVSASHEAARYLRLAPDQYLLGDWWHQKLLNEFENL